ncbi:MAG: hypothetical protein LCH37_14405 [Bacteroidetes bacterium]|nr:hypothetical protein [Bacteroidota bacterium]
MKKKELAKIALKLAELAHQKDNESETLSPPVSWRSSIYYALIYSTQSTEISIKWSTRYQQFNISHQLRANQISQLKIVQLKGGLTPGGELAIWVEFQDGATQFTRPLTLELSDFRPVLWTPTPDHPKVVLDSNWEAEHIFSLIKDSLIEVPNQIELINVTAQNSQKFKSLLDLINCSRPNYLKNETEQAYQAFLLTVLGAGVFYLPFGNDNFYGFASLKAIQESLADDGIEMVKDHVLPRKQAAKMLMNAETQNWTVEEFISWYVKNIQFMYVTKKENKSLVGYYERFDSYESALKRNGIEKFPTEGSFNSILEVKQFVAFLKKTSVMPQTSEEAAHMLIEFRNGNNTIT